MSNKDIRLIECPCGCGNYLSIVQSDNYENSIVIGVWKSKSDFAENFPAGSKKGFLGDDDVIKKLKEVSEDE